jgi:hypothetical protein
MNYKVLFDKYKAQLEGKKRIELLKQIEKITAEIWKSEAAYQGDRDILGTNENSRRKVLNVTGQNWEGIAEGTQEFFTLLDVASRRQTLSREFVKQALSSLPHEFNAFDRTLITHCADLSQLYDNYYKVWKRAVEGNAVAEQLAKDIAHVPQELYNHYTVIDYDFNTQQYSHVALASKFPQEIGAIVEQMHRLVKDIEQLEGLEPQQKLHIDFFKQYAHCLAITDIAQLEEAWKQLDRVWMDIKYYIQIVHDIEYGYGDPLRTKINPDFSLRFVDEEYAAANRTIEEVKHVMIKYFGARDKDLAKRGLFALNNSFAAIYYLPFVCAQSLHFRFSGQSIPNRAEVKDEKGVKIYFDPVSTKKRGDQARELCDKVCADPGLGKVIEPIGTIIYHVAAHEFGHAIYGLGHVGTAIKVETKTLLEEPRAELTALVTMKLLLEAAKISEHECQQHLASYALQELRRFAMFNSTSLRPYIISAINSYNKFEELGYVKLINNKLVFDETKTKQFLEYTQQLFEQILGAEDTLNGQTLEQICTQMQHQSALVNWLVDTLFHKH